jgi:SAM-dependent methyltransferase
MVRPALQADMTSENTAATYEPSRGYFDFVDYQCGRLLLEGWMFVAQRAFDDMALKVDGVVKARSILADRLDVNAVFGIPASTRTGFRVDLPLSEMLFACWVDIDVVGVRDGQEVAVLSVAFKLGYRSGLGEPPAQLIRRVIGSESRANHWASALMSFGEYRRAMKRHAPDPGIGRLLDWGCGCGRMTGLFLKHSGIEEIHGCDIDAEAVEWCRANLSGGRFEVIDPAPPTPYPDDYFGAILSYSVFTHLTRSAQAAWLQEMRRIIRPAGYFFASCHGDFATLFTDSSIQAEVSRNGISDASLDGNLDGVAPANYYRTTYQSQSYTVAEFGKHFRVVEYLPRADGSLQDLIVLQK